MSYGLDDGFYQFLLDFSKGCIADIDDQPGYSEEPGEPSVGDPP